MQEKEVMKKTCWKSMGGLVKRKCLGHKCVAWDWYDNYEVKYFKKNEEIPEGFKLEENPNNTGPTTFRYVKITKTGNGGCGALPAECGGCG